MMAVAVAEAVVGIWGVELVAVMVVSKSKILTSSVVCQSKGPYKRRVSR